MDEIDALIARYRAETSDRSGLLEELLPHVGDPRIGELLVAVAGDAGEDPSARIVAYRHFEYARPPEDERERDRLVKVLLGAVTAGEPRPDDRLVREYAARALLRYARRKDVMDVLVPILMNPAERYNMRRAAFDVVCSGNWPEVKPLFEALLSDRRMAQDAQILLQLRAADG